MRQDSCISESLLREALHNMTALKDDIDRSVQMQVFAAFMIVVALYDISANVRRFIESARAANPWQD
jgi:hypothetical protein